jgi:cytochrome c biogenesis protein
MLPVEMEGRMFYLSGVRREVSDPFQYLYVPAAPGGGIERFMEFNTRLHDPVRLQRVAENTANQSLQQSGLEQPGFASELTESMVQLLTLFASQGFDGIGAHVNRTVPEAERANVLEAYLKVLQTMLAALYAELLTDGGVDFSDGVTEADSLFFDDAVNAIGALGNYGAPLFVQLENFEHIQSTGLQIARAPGKTLVYFGFALLIAGVFCMFYVPAQRLWFWVDEADGATRVLFAGSGHRHPREFNRLFERMRDVLDEQFKGL